MGVQSLSTFVAKIDGLRKEHQLRNTKLVIDGNNLMYKLYCKYNKINRDDYFFGGNCVKLRQYFTTFFANLAKCKITPIFVFDGSLNPDFEDNRRKRFQEAFDRSKTLSDNPPEGFNFEGNGWKEVIFPFLLRKSFISVAKEGNVTCLQTRLDADLATAQLANELKCPLVSSDSDFLIMSIDEGVINCETFDWQNIQTSKNKCYIECKIYKITDFVEQFNLKPEMLPIFASLMGNDGIDGQIFDGLVDEINKDKTIELSGEELIHNGYVNERLERMILLLNWLSQKFFSATHAQNFILNYLQNNGINTDQFLTSVKSYESSKGTFLKTLVDHKDNETNEEDIPIQKIVEEQRVPKWFLIDFYHCKIDAVLFGFIDRQLFLMRPLVEDFNLESVFDCIQELCGYLLGILRLTPQDRTPIKMVVRAKSDSATILIEPKTNISLGGGDQEVPIVTELYKYSDIQKKDILFSILKFDERWIDNLREKLCLMKIDEEDIDFWSFFLVVFKYWKHKTKLYLRGQYFTFVRALVLSVINYRHESLIRNDFKGLMSLTKNRFKPNVIHYLNEFEVLYATVDKLISLLGYPIKSIELHHHLNGILYYNLFEEISADRLPFYAFKENRLNTLNVFIMASL